MTDVGMLHSSPIGDKIVVAGAGRVISNLKFQISKRQPQPMQQAR